jgi:hypothetical protein
MLIQEFVKGDGDLRVRSCTFCDGFQKLVILKVLKPTVEGDIMQLKHQLSQGWGKTKVQVVEFGERT